MSATVWSYKYYAIAMQHFTCPDVCCCNVAMNSSVKLVAEAYTGLAVGLTNTIPVVSQCNES